jgi:hypothetical protein
MARFMRAIQFPIGMKLDGPHALASLAASLRSARTSFSNSLRS